MADSPPAEMPPNLVQYLLGGQTLVMATVDEQGFPQTTIMTWAVARNPITLTVAVDARSRALKNLKVNSKVAVEVLGDDLCYGLLGTATVEKEAMDSTPFPSALVTIRIEDCKNHGAPGVLFVGPRYTFAPGKEHRKGVEEAVFKELQGTTPTI